MMRPNQIANAYASNYLRVEEDEEGTWLHFGHYRFLLGNLVEDSNDAVGEMRVDLAEHIQEAITEAFKDAHSLVEQVAGGDPSFFFGTGQKVSGDN